MTYKELYKNLKSNINRNSYLESIKYGFITNIEEYLKIVANDYKLEYLTYSLEYKKDIYTTYILESRILCCSFVITLKETNIEEYDFYITPLDYEYIHYSTNNSKDCLIDVFYGSMINSFGKLAIELDEFNYEYILLRKFKKELLKKSFIYSRY